jgi:hypothetical protein
MVTLARLVSWVALVGTILPAILFFRDEMTLDRAQLWMLVATAVWFAATPVWMDRHAAK